SRRALRERRGWSREMISGKLGLMQRPRRYFATVLLPVVCSSSLALAACCDGTPTESRTFAIDASRAASILDSEGHATAAGCAAVCEALVGADAAMADLDDAGPDLLLTAGYPVGCEVISRAGGLAVTCHWSAGCGL